MEEYLKRIADALKSVPLEPDLDFLRDQCLYMGAAKIIFQGE